MQHLFTDLERPLPDSLAENLAELLQWDNNCFLTWVSVPCEADPDGSRWFTVRLSSDGKGFGFQLEFWIPNWMSERGIAAVLPARLGVQSCEAGVRAAVELRKGRWSELKLSVPQVARTCARLINELWGPTESADLLLVAMEFQDERLPTKFSELPVYHH